MKIVLLDAYTTNPGDLDWSFLERFGETVVYDRTPDEMIFERIKDADIVVTNKTPLDRDILSRLDKLKFIALLSTGYNVVDCEYAKSIGVPVSNIPTYSTSAVAQLTFSFILEFTNAVAVHSLSVHNGEWEANADFCYWKTPLTELEGKTLGIIGFGKIGQAVANIAEGFNMNILAVSGHETDQSGRKNFRWASVDELLGQSDFVTLHCPLTEKTTGMVDEAFINKMKDGAILINTSRGPVLNEKAVADALNRGKLGGAGVDVLSTEPPMPDNPLLKAKNCLITPHIAWAGFETRKRLVDVFKRNIEAFINGTPINVVNP
ncbi:MAG: D-2-hydroxyacid dehydrogenase [Clostridia bacterium]|nr:D-2-hydroxyacid dehydrogenase [Clostridia bacterium]